MPPKPHRLSPTTTFESKEAFDLMSLTVDPTLPAVTEPPGFMDAMLHLDQACRELTLKLLRCLAIGLELPDEEFFIKCHQDVVDRSAGIDSNCLFRTIYYPVVKNVASNGEGQVRCGTHSDFGTMTLLFQDDVGGLEVESMEKGVFVPVLPVPGCVVVNIGDVLQRWTSDELRATVGCCFQYSAFLKKFRPEMRTSFLKKFQLFMLTLFSHFVSAFMIV